MLGDIERGRHRPAVRDRFAGDGRRARHAAHPRHEPGARHRSSSTSRSSCIRARCSASWRSRARARTSCSTSWPARSDQRTGELLVDGRPASFRHPADAIRRRSRLRPGRSRRGAPDAALGPREHRPAVHRTVPVAGARSTHAPRNRRVNGAVETLEIDTRAQGEVRRLSGGNQQKVTIARWVAGGVRTMLCFDPTRGIDIGTKRQIYALLRELAEAGAAVLLYTSELKEIQLACDRAIVIFNGRVVAEIPVEEADEPTLLRAAYDLPPDAADARGDRRDRAGGRGRRRADRRPRRRHERRGDRGRRREHGGAPGRAPATSAPGGTRGRSASSRVLVGDARRSPRSSSRTTAPPRSRAWPSGSCPVAFAAIAQAIIVISGGIDLSVASIMSLTGVTAAVLLEGPGRRRSAIAPRPRRPGAGAPGRRRSTVRSSS